MRPPAVDENEVKHSTVPHLARAAAPPYFLLLLSHNCSPQQKRNEDKGGKLDGLIGFFIMVRLWLCLYVFMYKVNLFLKVSSERDFITSISSTLFLNKPFQILSLTGKKNVFKHI